ncbi:MAG TPA: hypothetical protein VGI74_23000 [Streptosporangiaceae bacterium]|jgi:hypothetical protein
MNPEVSRPSDPADATARVDALAAESPGHCIAAGHTADPPAPAWTEEEYQQEVASMVAEEAPAVFAVVEDRDDRTDGRIAAWVLEFACRAEAVATDSAVRISAQSARRVLAQYGRQPGVTARLIPAGRASQLEPPA